MYTLHTLYTVYTLYTLYRLYIYDNIYIYRDLDITTKNHPNCSLAREQTLHFLCLAAASEVVLVGPGRRFLEQDDRPFRTAVAVEASLSEMQLYGQLW